MQSSLPPASLGARTVMCVTPRYASGTDGKCSTRVVSPSSNPKLPEFGIRKCAFLPTIGPATTSAATIWTTPRLGFMQVASIYSKALRAIGCLTQEVEEKSLREENQSGGP